MDKRERINFKKTDKSNFKFCVKFVKLLKISKRVNLVQYYISKVVIARNFILHLNKKNFFKKNKEKEFNKNVEFN